MKKIERIVYERGDHVEITAGYNKGMVGVVTFHDQGENEVSILLANQSIKPKARYIWDDEDEDESSDFDEKHVKYITEVEYQTGITRNNLIRIDGISEPIQYKGGRFIIGDNPITKANAKKLAAFITKHAKTKAKKLND